MRAHCDRNRADYFVYGATASPLVRILSFPHSIELNTLSLCGFFICALRAPAIWLAGERQPGIQCD